MNGLLELGGLVALAFFASSSLERNRRGLGVAGLYVLVGALLGPLGAAVLDEQFAPFLQPITSLCVTWLAFLFGIQLHAGTLKRIGLRGGGGTLVQTGAVAMLVAAGLHVSSLRVALLPALGIGLIASTSSRTAVRLARTRFGASGPVTTFLDRITTADDLVPILGLMALVAWIPSPHTSAALQGRPLWILAAQVGLGAAAGMLFPLAAGPSATLDRAWLVLLGMLFLGAGAAEMLGLPEMAVGLLAGVVVGRTGGVRVLQQVVSATKRPVTLLLLILVGARLAPDRVAMPIALLALGLRLVGKLAVGPVLGAVGAGGVDAGLGLLGYGGLALAGAAQFDLLYNAPVVLLAAAADAVAGDVLGPLGLRLLLGRRGEISTATPTASETPGALESAPKETATETLRR